MILLKKFPLNYTYKISTTIGMTQTQLFNYIFREMSRTNVQYRNTHLSLLEKKKALENKNAKNAGFLHHSESFFHC